MVRCWIVAVIAVCGCGRIGFGLADDEHRPDRSSDAIGTGDGNSSCARLGLVQSTNGWSNSRVTSRSVTLGAAPTAGEVPTEAGSTTSAMVTAYRFGDAVPTVADATMSGSDYWQMMLAAFE